MNSSVTSIESYQSSFSHDGFWNKLGKVAKKAGCKVVYYALLLYYVLISSKTPMKARAAILGALGYFILPTDLIPDMIPMAGYSDDLAAMMAVVVLVGEYITPEIEAKAKAKCQKWFPSEAIVF